MTIPKRLLSAGIALLLLLYAGGAMTMPQDSIKENNGYGKVYLLKGISFYKQTDSLLEQSYEVLDRLHKRLKEQKNLSLKIVGHVTTKVPKKQRLKLSALRANAIKNYLSDKGVKEVRLLALGMGAKQPRIEENPEDAVNNRIEVSFKKAPVPNKYGKKYLFENVKFSSMGDTLFASSYSALDRFAERLLQNKRMEIKIIGHAFTSGTEDYNMKLSLNRALSVKNYLVRKGVGPERIVCEGRGNTQPRKSEDPKARTKNNRIEVRFKKYDTGTDEKYRKPMRLKNVEFVDATAELKEGSEVALKKLGKLLKKKTGINIIIITYSTEKTGKDAITLSSQRSQKIRKYLIKNFMIDANRIELQEGGYPKTEDKPEHKNWVEIRLSK